MKVKLLRYTPEGEKLITSAAKLCYSPVGVDEIEEDLTDEAVDKFLNGLISMGHHSPIEHISFTFAIEGVSRALTHQLVRHRLASFSQQSQRYVSEKDFNYIVIPFDYIEDDHMRAEAYTTYLDNMRRTQKDYNKLIELGVAKEDARYLLPNATETKIVVTMNARTLLHFFSLRTCCFDQETEVLTDKGWKFFEDVKPRDLIYSLNPKTYQAEYSQIKKQFKYKYFGDMVRVKSQSIDQLITPNHKMFVSYSYENKNYTLENAIEHRNHKTILMKKNCEPISGKKTKQFTIPEVIAKDKNQHSEWKRVYSERCVNTKDFFRFLGMYISDGYCYNSGYHYMVGISKGDKEKIDYYAEILSRLSNNKVTKKKDRSSWKIEVHDRNLYTLLADLGGSLEKHIPDYVWEYDHTILRELFEGLKDGDTSQRACGTGLTYYTSSKQLADDIQRLLLHIGFSGTIRKDDRIGEKSSGRDAEGNQYNITTKNVSYSISINKSKNEPIIKTTNRDAFSTEKYEGVVRCLELSKNNILYIRRNGRTSWSGNSRAQWEIREMARRMLQEVKEVYPTVFKNAGPACVRGKCPEGKMSCGQQEEMRRIYG